MGSVSEFLGQPFLGPVEIGKPATQGGEAVKVPDVCGLDNGGEIEGGRDQRGQRQFHATAPAMAGPGYGGPDTPCPGLWLGNQADPRPGEMGGPPRATGSKIVFRVVAGALVEKETFGKVMVPEAFQKSSASERIPGGFRQGAFHLPCEDFLCMFPADLRCSHLKPQCTSPRQVQGTPVREATRDGGLQDGFALTHDQGNPVRLPPLNLTAE